MAYDRAKWHYEGDYPADLPLECGGTHIGMFLAWAIGRGLESAARREFAADELAQVRARTMTGRDFLFDVCAESLTEDDLDAVGNEFARAYYSGVDDSEPSYFDDYVDALTDDTFPTAYHVVDTWENFDRIAELLDRRFAEWRARTT